MQLTKSLKELVQRRVARDRDFAAALLREGIDTMLASDMDTGQATCATPSRRPSASRSSAQPRIRRPRA